MFSDLQETRKNMTDFDRFKARLYLSFEEGYGI
jgi:hypothetical protein